MFIDKQRKAELRAQKDKVFDEKDMIIMKQMQNQQMGLQKLIQEFRENNADKLIDENKQLYDRLADLEVEEHKSKKREYEDVGYSTMPTGNSDELTQIRKN